LNWERQLEELASHREDDYQKRLTRMTFDHPENLLRQLRAYLARQADYHRLKRSAQPLRLETSAGNVQELVCDEVEFESDSKLTFNIEMVEAQTAGWLVKRFKYQLQLPGRGIDMVRIHLNQEPGLNALKVPRCHLHLGSSEAHIPFPIMNPLLMVHLICEHIEPDVGKSND